MTNKIDIGELLIPAAVLGGAGYVAGRVISGKKAGMAAGAMGVATGAIGAIAGQRAKEGGAIRKALQAVDVTRDRVAVQDEAAADVRVSPEEVPG